MFQTANSSEQSLYDQFICAIQTNNVTHEIMKVDEYETLIGVTRGKGLWHWFRYVDYHDEQFLLFKESYSQNSGATRKGTAHRMWVYDSVERLIGFNFFPEISTGCAVTA